VVTISLREVKTVVAEEEDKRLEADEATMMRQLREELQNLTVGDHLLFMMHSLSALAIDRMGLSGDEGRRDLGEARLAIDAFKALVELLERTRPAREMAAHRSALSQLQLSYVGALSGGASPGAPGPQPAQDRTATEPKTGPEPETGHEPETGPEAGADAEAETGGDSESGSEAESESESA
jgi:hypothetical protein